MTTPKKDDTPSTAKSGSATLNPHMTGADPGPFQRVDASVNGTKLRLDSPTQAWSGDIETGNAAYASALMRAIGQVNIDFDSRRPKATPPDEPKE